MVDDCAEMRRLLAANNDVICESGYTKPLASASLSDMEEISRTVFLHQTIFRSMAEWGQLGRSLNVLGVCEEMARSPDTLLGFFTSACTKPLTAGLDTYVTISITVM